MDLSRLPHPCLTWGNAMDNALAPRNAAYKALERAEVRLPAGPGRDMVILALAAAGAALSDMAAHGGIQSHDMIRHDLQRAIDRLGDLENDAEPHDDNIAYPLTSGGAGQDES